MIFHTKNAGQATIEFLFTFVFSVGILFLFVSLAINFTSGYIAHYATYMASRTYLTYDNTSFSESFSDDYAKAQAQEVFESFKLEKLAIKNGVLEFNEPSANNRYEYVGVRYSFEKNLSLFKPFGGNQKSKLVSESFLGREPIRATCLKQTCKAIAHILQKSGLGGTGDTCDNPHTTLFDNGC